MNKDYHNRLHTTQYVSGYSATVINLPLADCNRSLISFTLARWRMVPLSNGKLTASCLTGFLAPMLCRYDLSGSCRNKILLYSSSSSRSSTTLLKCTNGLILALRYLSRLIITGVKMQFRVADFVPCATPPLSVLPPADWHPSVVSLAVQHICLLREDNDASHKTESA